MKKLYSLLVLSLLFAAPSMGANSLDFSEVGGGTRVNSGVVGGGNSNEIPAPLLNHILQLAAPQFGISVRWLTIQHNRGRVTITQVAQNLYTVTYGGITIQILIESGSTDFGLKTALRN